MPHATCNLNASLGVGIQMGYTRARHLSVNGTLHCTAAAARHGSEQLAAASSSSRRSRSACVPLSGSLGVR